MPRRLLLLAALACACHSSPATVPSPPPPAASTIPASPPPVASAIASPPPPVASADAGAATDSATAGLAADFEAARSANRAGRDEEARAILRRAIPSALAMDAPVDRRAHLRVLGRLSSLATITGETNLALEGFRAQMAILEADPALDPALLPLVRADLGEGMRRTGDCAGARRIEEALVSDFAKEVPPDHPRLLDFREGLAQSISCDGDPSGACKILEEVLALRLAAVPRNDKDVLGTRRRLGELCRLLGDLPRARSLAEESLAELEQILAPDDVDLQIARQGLAIVLGMQGETAAARELLEPGLAILERRLPDSDPNLLGMRINMASLLQDSGALHAATPILRRVIETLERAQPRDEVRLALARSNLGGLLYNLGESEEAMELTLKAREVFERMLPDDHNYVSLARGNEAALLVARGDLLRAREILEHELEIRERTRPPDDPDLHLTRGQLAGVLSGLGDTRGARVLMEQALEGVEANFPPGHPSVSRARSNLASLLGAAGDHEAARALLEQALAVQEVVLPPEAIALASTRLNLARTLEALDELPAARELMEKSLKGFEAVLTEGDPSLREARTSMAILRMRQEDLAGARQGFERVLATDLAFRPADGPEVQKSRMNLALVLGMTGALEPMGALVRDVVDAYRRRLVSAHALSDRELGEAVHEADNPVSTVLMLAAEPESPADLQPRAFELVETLRSVASATPGELGEVSDDPQIAELRRAVLDRRGEVQDRAAEAQRPGADRSRSTQALAAAVRELDQAERELRGALEAQGRVPRAIELTALAQALPVGSAAVGYRRYSVSRRDVDGGAVTDMLLAHVVTSEGDLARVELGRLDAVDGAISRWRAALGESPGRGLSVGARPASADDPARAGEILRALVLDPVSKAAGDARTLHVCPDDDLFLVPLDALPLEGGLVGDRLAIRNEISFARLLGALEPPKGEPILLAMGGIDFGPAGSFTPLSGSQAEVEEIGELFERKFPGQGRLLTGSAATRASFVEQAPSARYVHLATHGYFAGEEMPSTSDTRSTGKLWSASSLHETVAGMAPMSLCGLAFAGANTEPDASGRAPGILTAEELSGLDLSGCELAVLSACETNVGIRRAGQGIRSLQTGLRAAGARTTLTTLWRVGDQAARELMVEFYRRVWEGGESKAEALWNAKRTMRERGVPAREWAAWVLYGDPE
ncbi:MAG: CHAT domain-containing protein [Planctomycetota bacterium]